MLSKGNSLIDQAFVTGALCCRGLAKSLAKGVLLMNLALVTGALCERTSNVL